MTIDPNDPLGLNPLDSDVEWARKNGWKWTGDGFEPVPFVRVIPNPVGEGWCPWVSSIGALQIDAPFGSVRAALRVAEQIRQQRVFNHTEMSCAEDV